MGGDKSPMANAFARRLRKDMTGAERALWGELRDIRRQGYHFRRQVPIERYIVDFACLSQRLIIEVDGVQHMESEHQLRDENRDARLHSQGFNVLRFSNSDVLDSCENVMFEILTALGAVGRRE